jgi:hypothetical protein
MLDPGHQAAGRRGEIVVAGDHGADPDACLIMELDQILKLARSSCEPAIAVSEDDVELSAPGCRRHPGVTRPGLAALGAGSDVVVRVGLHDVPALGVGPAQAILELALHAERLALAVLGDAPVDRYPGGRLLRKCTPSLPTRVSSCDVGPDEHDPQTFCLRGHAISLAHVGSGSLGVALTLVSEISSEPLHVPAGMTTRRDEIRDHRALLRPELQRPHRHAQFPGGDGGTDQLGRHDPARYAAHRRRSRCYAGSHVLPCDPAVSIALLRVSP